MRLCADLPDFCEDGITLGGDIDRDVILKMLARDCEESIEVEDEGMDLLLLVVVGDELEIGREVKLAGRDILQIQVLLAILTSFNLRRMCSDIP